MWQKGKQDARKNNTEPAKVKLFKNPLKTVETTIISAGSKLEGSIETAGTLIVDGSVTGNIKCGSLEVLQDGNLEAKVEAENVSVAGSIEGEIICNGKLTVFSKGKVIGDVSYGTLSIESGGALNGSVSKSKSASTPILPLYQKGN
jgi:cytoskeletal protein CcmA (bactofilin family)